MTTMTTLGWREWVSLPELTEIPIKAKVDTGARTSALHAFFIEPYEIQDRLFVTFRIHPIQKDLSVEVECHAAVVDQRVVSDSGGHREQRYIIETPMIIDGRTHNTELTLTDRDTMLFRMLIGRNALKGKFTVDSAASFLTGGNSNRPPA